MIHQFAFENFCSFADPASMSFVVGKQAPKSDLFFDSESGLRLSKVLATIGPNGSGKTNLLKALTFLTWFARSSFHSLSPEQEIPIDKFAFNGDDQVTPFCLDFENSGVTYRYEVDLTQKTVLREILSQRFENSYRYLVKRVVGEDGRTDLKTQHFGIEAKTIMPLLRGNASVLSVLAQTEHKESQNVLSFFRGITTNVYRLGRREYGDERERSSHILQASKLYFQSEELKASAERILGDLDLGLSGIKIDRRETKGEEDQPIEVFLPYGIHCIRDKEHYLSFSLESSGTKNLFVLLTKILPVLHDGGLAIIDEFEVDLHAHMIPSILNLFFDPHTNPKNAQLLFSSHSLEILRELDKNQIQFVSKDENCASMTWRLDSMTGVRRQDNLYAKYMSGAYGAIPNL